MDNYLQVELKNYDNFDEIIYMKNRINKLYDKILENKNITYELNCYSNNNLKKNSAKVSNIINANFYLKINNEECPICYEVILYYKSLACKHSLCNTCFNKWNNVCSINFENTTCPICRKILIKNK